MFFHRKHLNRLEKDNNIKISNHRNGGKKKYVKKFVSREERKCCLDQNLSFICKKFGHYSYDCLQRQNSMDPKKHKSGNDKVASLVLRSKTSKHAIASQKILMRIYEFLDMKLNRFHATINSEPIIALIDN